MTEVPVGESLRCVFFFCVGWLGSWSSCFLEVVASYAGEEFFAYGSQESHQVVSAQRKKENKRRQSSICPNTRVVAFSESAVVVSFFPYFLIDLTPMDQ